MKKQMICFLFMIILALSVFGNTFAAGIPFIWQREPDLPVERGYVSAVAVNDKIYCFNGYTLDQLSTRVDIYDTVTKTWTTGQSMNIGRCYTSSVAIDDKIYVVGGYNINTNIVMNTLEVYDTVTDTWAELKSKPTAVASPGICVIDGEIYALGGYLSHTNPQSSAVVEIYNPANDLWRTGAPMNNARAAFGVAVLDNNVYAIGGRDGAAVLSKMDIYDLTAKQWSAGTPLPIPTSYNAVEVINDQLYSFGGSSRYADANATLDTISKYDPATETWINDYARLSSRRSMMGSTIINNKLYLIGGAVSDALSIVESTSFDKLFVLLDPGEQCQASLTHDLSENYDYNWSSVDSSIASVDAGGLITAQSEGQTYILCTSFDGLYSDYIPVKVQEGASEIRLAVHLEHTGDQKKLWLSDTAPVTWNTIGPSVADVDSRGIVTARGRGLTVIEGSVNGKTYHIYVRVNAAT